MKIIVTGGGGFVGRWFVDAAIDTGHSVRSCGRSERTKVTTFSGREIPYKQVNYEKESLARVFAGCDAVVHLAASRFARADDWEGFSANLKVSLEVLSASAEVGVSQVVLVSSRSVYSDRNPLPWLETTPPAPRDLYGVSKASMELIGDIFCKRDRLRVVSLRVAQVLGFGERDGFMLTTFLERAHSGKPLEIYGQGIARREYVYVKDVADAILAALSNPEAVGPFNIGTGLNHSTLELAEAINRAFENQAELTMRANLPEIAEENLMSTAHTRAELGWTARWSLDAALRDIRALMDQREAKRR